ncbi:MAG: type I-B CRISPR-associated protein Cas5 [Halanaerobiales bacterium]|nr:type I-B CRISPR-associated protein Cas5 [Halanaerobiales bacterium]
MTTKTLVFDIWADYAHFKKYFTTTSPLTFSIPPKTVIYGILGAIIGLEKDEYLEYFQNECKVGIQILNPIKKVRIGLNLIDTKKAKGIGWNRIEQRTQIRTEFLKDPKYRLYIAHDNLKIYEALKKYIQTHKSVFTVSLGLSECLANFRYVGEEEVERIQGNDEFVEVVTSFRIDDGNVKKGDINFDESGKEYFLDKVAIEMKPDREVVDYGQVLFERSGKGIKLRPQYYYRISSGENILFI